MVPIACNSSEIASSRFVAKIQVSFDDSRRSQSNVSHAGLQTQETGLPTAYRLRALHNRRSILCTAALFDGSSVFATDDLGSGSTLVTCHVVCVGRFGHCRHCLSQAISDSWRRMVGSLISPFGMRRWC